MVNAGAIATAFVNKLKDDTAAIRDGEMVSDHGCTFGYVYRDPVEQIMRRGRTREEAEAYVAKTADNPKRFAVPCPVCAFRTFDRRFFRSQGMTWKTWQPYEPMEHGIHAIRHWHPNQFDRIIAIHGNDDRHNSGNGKTHILSAVLHHQLRKFRSVFYRNAADFSGSPWDNNCDPLKDATGLMLLDDLGNEYDNAAMREVIDRMLDARYRNGFLTIFTTTLSLSTIADRYPRTMRRVKFCTRVEWVADSFR